MVFRDLEDAAHRVLSAASAPASARRALRDFVSLTQQLTAVMRKEFSALAGRPWVAADFAGWTPTTALFKKLRNADHHDFPFLVYVRRDQSLPARQLVPDAPPHLEFALISETHLADPHTDDIPSSGLALHTRPAGSRAEPVASPWHKSVDRLFIHGRSSTVRKALAAAGTDEVVPLVTSCLASLRDYHQYYRDRLLALKARSFAVMRRVA